MRKGQRGSKNHHYVPQCYLRYFAIKYKKGHQLSVFDRVSDKSFKSNVKNICCQNAFNRIEVDGMDPNALEEAMSEFESKLANALVRINETRSLANEEDHAYLITLIGLTALRNPHLRETIRKIHEKAAKLNISERLRSKEAYDESVLEAKRQGALPEDYNVTYEEMKKAFEAGVFKLILKNNHLISQEFRLLDHILPLLFRRGWQLVRAPMDTGGYITSDRPFFLTWSNPAMRAGKLSPGLALRLTQIYFPISPQLAVVGAFEIENGEEDVGERRVALMNGAMVQNADRQVYARNHCFSYTMTLDEPSRKGGQLISDKRFPLRA
jgi:hypothetical protein